MTVRWLLNGEPRPVQIEAMRQAEGRKGFGYFLEQRLGKTNVVLNEFKCLYNDGEVDWVLVISPNSFKEDWRKAADKWGFGLPVHVFDSRGRKDFVVWRKRNDHGMVVCNYEALGYSVTMGLLRSVLGSRTCLVCDESIKIKSPSSGVTRAALDMAKRCGYRRILSGKPITQGASDLYSQLRFLGELDGVLFSAFKARYCEMGGFQGRQEHGVRNEEELAAIRAGCSFTARKIDWIDGFQSPDYVVRRVELDPEHLRLYRQMQREFLVELVSGEIVTAQQAVTKMMKCQQLASGFIIDEDGKAHDVVAPNKNPRIAAIKSLLEEELSTKLMVVAHYRHSIDMLLAALESFNPSVIRRGADLIEQKRKFNEDSSSRVIITQDDCVKYGHELVGTPDDPCLTMAMFETSYSLDTRSQVEERNSYGDKSVARTIIDFSATDADDRTIAALVRKEDVASALMGFARETGVLPVINSNQGLRP